jgi:hypothetical protein
LKNPEEEIKDAKNSPFMSPSDFLPMIKRGITSMIEDDEKSLVSVGWKVEVTSRKEREETLR